jgi:predicted adenine nucleotide alpha hydrolase (AANH) superfamily ATPase
MHSCCAPCAGEIMEALKASEIDYFLYKTTAQVLTEKIDDTITISCEFWYFCII